MDTKGLEELSMKLAEKHGMTQEDAASIIIQAAKIGVVLAEIFWLVNVVLLEKVKLVRETIKEVIEFVENQPTKSDCQDWTINWDTRKRRQVMSNKPRYLVRKIIG